MPTNYFAIFRDGDEAFVKRIVVNREVQLELESEFQRQAKSFITYSRRVPDDDGKRQLVADDSERIEFFPIYSLSDHSQVFEVDDFPLDKPILDAAKAPDSVDALTLDNDSIAAIRAICAVQRSRSSVKVIFQAFDRRKALSQDRWTFLQDRKTFRRLQQPGFTLGENIQAIYDNGTLLFRSFTVVSRFINLVSMFNEASSERIEGVLSHDVFHVADAGEVIEHADTTMRKQFAAVSELGVLDKAKPNKVKEVAAEYGIDIEVGKHNGKRRIEFPEAKKQQKELLTFLTEGYYTGPLTGNKYQSNSHRPLKAK
jgi:hypothetical protein